MKLDGFWIRVFRCPSDTSYISWIRGRVAVLMVVMALLLASCSRAGTPSGAIPVQETPIQVQNAPVAGPTATIISQPVDEGNTPLASTETFDEREPTLSSTTAPGEGVPPTPLSDSAEVTEAPIPPTSFPDPAHFTWQPVANGLNSPVGLAAANDGAGRLFILEQAGRIRILRDGHLMPEPFLDIVSMVGSSGNEQGLLGLAFHPRFVENGNFYVNYTDLDGNTKIARFSVSVDNPDRADAASQEILLSIEQPYQNHNGGMAAFGPDGNLYLGLGDGGSAGDPQDNAQNLGSLLGKILRIDVDAADPYGIPSDNPFANGSGQPEIWAYGLRNPWRFSFDRLTGDLYIADVGQNKWEEISFLRAGSAGRLNLGWDYFEASYLYEDSPPAAEVFLSPVAEYTHEQGCSITGGYVYRGAALPEWQGIYVFGDFCTGDVWGLLHTASVEWQTQVLYRNVGRITSFGEDETGELYLVDRAGFIYRLGR